MEPWPWVRGDDANWAEAAADSAGETVQNQGFLPRRRDGA